MMSKNMSTNKDLHRAKTEKNDEFYTQLSDIENELKHYREYFKDKVVFCNCNDSFESNFYKYFLMNFNTLGIRKLISTSFSSGKTAFDQLNSDSKDTDNVVRKKPHKIVIDHVEDLNGDGVAYINNDDLILKQNTFEPLTGDGDFRRKECLELLKQADIVVSNPPFSLFREYITQLVAYDKKFIIIGNQNAVTYKEVFPLIKANKLWFGASIHSGDREFRVPDIYPLNASGTRVDNDGNKYIRVKGVRWFTNIDYEKRHTNLALYRTYNANDYPVYDNYKAINVDKISDIPYDYDGVIGVPITFLDKYNPEQFEIIGLSASWDESANMKALKTSEKYRHNPIIAGKDIYRRMFIKKINRKD